jgi:hypothetical protein
MLRLNLVILIVSRRIDCLYCAPRSCICQIHSFGPDCAEKLQSLPVKVVCVCFRFLFFNFFVVVQRLGFVYGISNSMSRFEIEFSHVFVRL